MSGAGKRQDPPLDMSCPPGDAPITVPAARCVIFDFDGTLAPNLDLPDMRRQVIALTREHEVPEPVYADRYIVEIIDAASDWLSAQRPEAARDYHARAHRLITEFELAAARRTLPFAEIPDALAALRAADVGLGVVTRNCAAAVRAVFADIDRYCTAVLARDDVAYLKPDPRHVQLALDRLQCAAPDSIMVGDGQLDMHVGRALGMFCVGVLTGSSDAERLHAAGADLVLPRAADLTPLILAGAGR
ncbi:MAG: HAD family hydrolase [Pseudomonadales bacterium]